MTSPLLAYSTALLVTSSEGTPEVVNGRIAKVEGQRYIIQCYLKRQQSTGTSTGADYLPTQATTTNTLPGSSGFVYLYAGYALRYATIGENFILETSSLAGLSWIEMKSIPAWLVNGIVCEHKQGIEPIKYCKIERISGVYGNEGIDKILIDEIGGVPIVVRSGDLID